MREIWKDIEGYEGLYQVSNQGRVKSLERTFARKHINGVITVRWKQRILQGGNGGSGYRVVFLSNGAAVNTHPIHRLVAQAFIPNPDNLPEVNHRNEDKTDNRVENLEWCSHQYNNSYGTLHTRASLTKRKKGIIYNFAVVQFALDGTELARYNSVPTAAKATGLWCSSIYKVCKGKLHQTGGYRWAFVDE